MPENEEIIIGGVKLTDEEKARLAVEEWRRTRRTEVTRTFSNSTIAMACATILGSVVFGRLIWWRFNKHKPGYIGENYLLNTRMYAQGSLAMGLLGYLYFDLFKRRYLDKRGNKEDKDK